MELFSVVLLESVALDSANFGGAGGFEPPMLKGGSEAMRVRSLFPETWLWSNQTTGYGSSPGYGSRPLFAAQALISRLVRHNRRIDLLNYSVTVEKTSPISQSSSSRR